MKKYYNFILKFIFIVFVLVFCFFDLTVGSVNYDEENSKNIKKQYSNIQGVNKKANSVKKEKNTQNEKIQKVIDSIEDYNSTNLPVIAALPNDNIYLYGIKPSGTVLYYKNSGHFYDWGYLTPRFILPEISLGDFNNDGHKELAVILYVGSGTGYSIDELHIVDLYGNEFISKDPNNKNFMEINHRYFDDNCFDQNDYLSQLDRLIKYKAYYKAGKLMGRMTVNNQTTIINLGNYIPSDARFDLRQKLSYGDIVKFYTEGNILRAKLAIGIMNQTYATPSYFGDIYADVMYRKGKFRLKNLRFQIDNEL